MCDIGLAACLYEAWIRNVTQILRSTITCTRNGLQVAYNGMRNGLQRAYNGIICAKFMAATLFSSKASTTSMRPD